MQTFCYTPIEQRDTERTSKRWKSEVRIEGLCMARSTSNPKVKEDSRFPIGIEDELLKFGQI
jgi:hypothetical protein